MTVPVLKVKIKLRFRVKIKHFKINKILNFKLAQIFKIEDFGNCKI